MPIPIVTLFGKAASDAIDLEILLGTSVAAEINGLAGQDTLSGGGYDDTLIGGGGNDRLDGRAGADMLRGGEGGDSFILRPGSKGRDTIDGGAGSDTLILRITEAQAADAALQAEIAAVQAALAANPNHRIVALGADFRSIDQLIVEVVANRRATNLNGIDSGGRGISLVGENAGDHAGSAVAALGDINGDGLADVLVGAPGSDANGLDSGAAYVVLGTTTAGPIDLAAIAAGQGGYRIVGQGPGDLAGGAVAAAGDVNGDGIGDLIVGAPEAGAGGQSQAGAAYVVFGGGTGPIDLGEVARGNGGFRIAGAAGGDFAGYAVGAVGDLNGDGLADLLVSAPKGASAPSDSGAVHVVLGKTDGRAVSLADFQDGVDGITIVGELRFDQNGIAVSGGGDVNGDGVADLVIGAWKNDGPGGIDSGAAYVVFGRPDLATVDLDDVALGVGGFKLTGEFARDEAGFSVAIVGDVNGDGLADIGIGARGNDNTGHFDNGAVYVAFGKADTATISLGQVAFREGGFKIRGEASSDQLGWAVAAAGDINGDGLGDLLVGAPLNDGADRFQNGAVYVVYGKTDNDIVDLEDVRDGIGGFKIRGEASSDFAGRAISAAGDVNGDGFFDLLIGAPGNDAGGDGAGAAYILFGGSTWLA